MTRRKVYMSIPPRNTAASRAYRTPFLALSRSAVRQSKRILTEGMTIKLRRKKMNTEKESAFRILSHREGSVQPMFDAAPIGPLSPSSSLLVERRDLEPTSWQSHLLDDQLLHFFMKPAVIGYSL